MSTKQKRQTKKRTTSLVVAAQTATPEQSTAFWKRIQHDVIAANVDAIAQAFQTRLLPVVGFELTPGPLDPKLELARKFGLDPGKVLSMSFLDEKNAERVASIYARTDRVTAAWFRRHETNRLFLMVNSGTFLLNFEQGAGWSVESGSTDDEYFASIKGEMS